MSKHLVTIIVVRGFLLPSCSSLTAVGTISIILQSWQVLLIIFCSTTAFTVFDCVDIVLGKNICRSHFWIDCWLHNSSLPILTVFYCLFPACESVTLDAWLATQNDSCDFHIKVTPPCMLIFCAERYTTSGGEGRWSRVCRFTWVDTTILVLSLYKFWMSNVLLK